jgi:nicotinamidase-related amidase
MTKTFLFVSITLLNCRNVCLLKITFHKIRNISQIISRARKLWMHFIHTQNLHYKTVSHFHKPKMGLDKVEVKSHFSFKMFDANKLYKN